jgi:hypothetical protein
VEGFWAAAEARHLGLPLLPTKYSLLFNERVQISHQMCEQSPQLQLSMISKIFETVICI